MKILVQFFTLMNELLEKKNKFFIHNMTNDKEIVNALLEEYRQLSGEILKRVEWQQGIIKLYLIIFAAIVGSLIPLLKLESPNYNLVTFFLLLSCFPFYFLSWSFTNHDFMICTAAKYVNTKIYPQIRHTLSCQNVFNWESFLSQERNWRIYKFPRSFIYGEENLLPIIIPSMLVLLSIALISKDFANLIIHKKYSLKQTTYLIEDPLVHYLLLMAAKIVLLIINFIMIFAAVKMQRKVREKYKSINTIP